MIHGRPGPARCALFFGPAGDQRDLLADCSDRVEGRVVTQLLVDDVGEVALERAHGVAYAASFASAVFDGGAGARVRARLGERHHVQCVIQAAVAAAVEPRCL